MTAPDPTISPELPSVPIDGAVSTAYTSEQGGACMPEPDKIRVRLSLPDKYHQEMRVLAARSGGPLSQYAEAVVLDAIRRVRDKGLRWIDLRPETQEEWRRELEDRSARTTWVTGGAHNWYLTEDGHSTNNWPGPWLEYRRRTLLDVFPLEGVELRMQRQSQVTGVSLDFD